MLPSSNRMNELFVPAQTQVKERYAVVNSSALMPAFVSGWEKTACRVMISPALGSPFCAVLANLQPDGQCLGNTGADEYLIFVLEGQASVLLAEKRHRLEPGNYAYVPPSMDMQINSGVSGARLVSISKRYNVAGKASRPVPVVAHEREVRAQAIPGAEGATVKPLLPGDIDYDMALELISFEPGASLANPLVRSTESGWFLWRGRGIARVDSDWHEVETGDAIRVAPYCSLALAGLGRQPTVCINWRATNRDPL